MFANTGIISFILYGVFIAITIVTILFTFYLIKKGEIESDKLDKMIELFKYGVVSIAITTTTLIVSDLFKEREQDINELVYFDKYAQDIKKVDGIQERYQLSKYLSIVAPNGEMKNSWSQYYDTVQVEYKEYLKLKKEEKKLDNIINPNQTQIAKKEEVKEKIMLQESPLVSFEVTPVNTKDIKKAKIYEEMGYEFLIIHDINNAINAFTKSQNSYNGFHQVYEISIYLRANEQSLKSRDSEAWKKTFNDIVKLYSFGMPSQLKTKLISISK